MTFTWQNGRQLASVSQNGTTVATYTYDADGLRTSKTVGETVTEYYWMNGMLYGQKTGEEYIFFLYDENGNVYGFVVKNSNSQSYYYYEFNLQGDIIGIINSSGTRAVEYAYGVWGDILSITGTLADTIGQKNPLRYRGYYYDIETGFYYLQSRYYDAEICRFLNADGYVSTGQNINGFNMFAYCGNNPVSRADYTGLSWSGLWEFAQTAIREIKNALVASAPAYASVGSIALADGPIPIGDIIAGIGFTALTMDAILNGVNQASQVQVEIKEQEKPVVKPGQQPTQKDGYIAPKNGPVKGKNKDGKIGWKDKNGNIWVPQPIGSVGAHGGGHWDVQSPKGGYVNVCPGGIIRGGKAPYPNIPIYP